MGSLEAKPGTRLRRNRVASLQCGWQNSPEVCPRHAKSDEASEILEKHEDIGVGKLLEEQVSGAEEEDTGESRGL